MIAASYIAANCEEDAEACGFMKVLILFHTRRLTPLRTRAMLLFNPTHRAIYNPDFGVFKRLGIVVAYRPP